MLGRKRMRATFLWACTASVLVFCLAFANQFSSNLKYKPRGNRWEGILQEPRGGRPLELLSARIKSLETNPEISGQLHIRFYLPEKRDVHLRVTEIENKYNYRLDRVEQQWSPQRINTFSWPAGEVLGKFRELQLSNLGVVVRLGNSGPDEIEQVAPAAIYRSEAPDRVTGYLFTFRVNSRSDLVAKLYRDKSGAAVGNPKPYPRTPRGPLTVHWPNFPSDAGEYTLVLGGRIRSTRKEVKQTVHFYHQPNLR